MKVAVCGAWHVHATDYTRHALETEGVEVLGFYEEDPELGKAFAERMGVPAFPSFQALLDSDADAVIVCTSSDTHADYMVAIAEAGKDIFTEKVLALTIADCLRIKEAVEKNNVRFVISLPHKKMPGVLAIKALADSGELGRLNFVRFRNCHTGSIAGWLPTHFFSKKQCGGGAMIDLGAHGMYLIDWFLGQPATYRSTFTIWDNNPKNVDHLEDNAVTVMSFADGSIAINETGFVSFGSPLMLEVGGDQGYARFALGEGVIKSTKATERKPVFVELPEALPLPIQSFLAGETPADCGMDEALRLTQMMEGAYNQ